MTPRSREMIDLNRCRRVYRHNLSVALPHFHRPRLQQMTNKFLLPVRSSISLFPFHIYGHSMFHVISFCNISSYPLQLVYSYLSRFVLDEEGEDEEEGEGEEDDEGDEAESKQAY